jgi:ParB family chromosome partitioning protein
MYEIIAGERRWRAATKAMHTSINILILDVDDSRMLELALIENLQREDLNAIDRARAYAQFCERFGLEPEEVAQRIGEDRSTVANYMRLLELSGPIQAMVATGKLGMSHARCLLGLEDVALRQRLADAIVKHDLSVRATEELVRRGKESAGDASGDRRAQAHRSAHLRDMEQRFERALKTKVTIVEGRRKGSGRLTIEFYTLDDFDRIAEQLGIQYER